MKTKQVLIFSQNGEDFAKRLKHCDLKEKIILYSVKEIVKDYICKLDKKQFDINKFKDFFENEIKSVFNFKINVDEKTYCAEENRYIFMFYFLENEIKKHIQVCVN